MNSNLIKGSIATKKIAIVTGSNTGIGYETAIGLVKNNYHVIMACRDSKKAMVAKTRILVLHPQAQIEFMTLDLSSLSYVREFVTEFKSKYGHLNLLVNNAGILIPPFQKTIDGFESQMGVNYFAHFLLTNLLFDLLDRTEDSRVVSLTSFAYKSGKIEFDNLNSQVKYNKNAAYGQSKLAILMFTLELQRRIEKQGSKVKAIAVHPGMSKTNLGQYTPKALMFVIRPLFSILGHSVDQAAKPTLLAALGSDVKGGELYGPTGFAGMKGKPGKIASTDAAQDARVAEKLWEVTEALTGSPFLRAFQKRIV
jgi:NAD(P)-dependent dehydrogenase (short-subunit alcohol dehydrogenase family)